MSDLTRYAFRDAVSGFFEIPADSARRLVPLHLQPMELHHGAAVLSVTAFDFTESMVGAYSEVVLSVIVAPLVTPGERLPKSAFYPFQVGTTTRASRAHAIERWHLPHWMEDLDIRFQHGRQRVEVEVLSGGAPVLGLAVGEHSWQATRQLYQCFMKNDAASYLAHITMEGSQSEHEEEAGFLSLSAHPFYGPLDVGDVSDVPFREIWMRDGLQTFEPLLQLDPA